MRKPDYLSPTSLMSWKKDKEEFYLNYLADKRPPRDPQTQPMAVGSAFDAYVKSYLYDKIVGKSGALADQFDFITIFENQVEQPLRSWALEAGKEVMGLYKKSGALADMVSELANGKSEPRFEFTVRGVVEGVPLLGKPDVWYINKEDQPILLDWKVNGYCSRGRSPSKGYVRLRDVSGNLGKSHKDAVIFKTQGIMVNHGHSLHEVEKSWATQLSTYAWLCGASVGDTFVSAIDQIYRNRKGELGVAEHRCFISEGFQQEVIGDYKELWDLIEKGEIFDKERQEMLDEVHQAYKTDIAGFMKDMKEVRPF